MVDHLGKLTADRTGDATLRLLVGPVIRPPDDVRDAEVEVVGNRRELIGRRPVRPQQGDASEPERPVRIPARATVRLRAFRRCPVDVAALALADRALVPGELEPAEIVEDRVLPALDDPRRIGVVDAEQEHAIVLVGEAAVRDGGERVAEV